MSENDVNDNCFHFSSVLIFRTIFSSNFLIIKQYRSASNFESKRVKEDEKENK